MMKNDAKAAASVKSAFERLALDGEKALLDSSIQKRVHAALGATSGLQTATKILEQADMAKRLSGINGSMTRDLAAMGAPFDRLKRQYEAAFGALAGIEKAERTSRSELSGRLADQFKAIDSLRSQNVSPPATLSIPEPRLPPNPIHETNKRLAKILDRFDKMEAIAVESAEIATRLQAYAAEFLEKFEKAANDNSKAAKHAITLGICAVLVALIAPLASILYAEYWRVPADTLSSRKVINDLRKDISGLQDTQRAVTEKLVKIQVQSNHDVSVALNEIRDLLSKQQSQASK